MRHDPGFPAEFSRVLLSAPNLLSSPFFFNCVSVPEDLCIYTGRTATASENDAGGCGGQVTGEEVQGVVEKEKEMEEKEEEDLLPR